MEVFLATASTAALGLLAWTLKELHKIGKHMARIQLALFGDGNVDEEEPVLPLVQAVADLRRRVRANEVALAQLKEEA